jgi:RNA polymerase sigma factor (sigma-70 family)
MPKAERSDEELMMSYCKGSEEAFEILYKRHSGKVFGFLRSRVKSEQLAADLFQEVFVKMHKSKHLYDTSRPLLPWLFSITHSVMIDGLRQIERKKENYDLDVEIIAQETTVDANDIRTLSSLTDALPLNQRAALQMRYVDEKTFQEIANVLQTSPMNVRQIISRAVKQLKKSGKEGGANER